MPGHADTVMGKTSRATVLQKGRTNSARAPLMAGYGLQFARRYHRLESV